MSRLIVAVLVILFSIPLSVKAYQYEFPEPENYDANIEIEDPVSYRVYYSSLNGFPHSYTLNLEDDTNIYLDVAVPNTDNAEDNRSVIIVRKLKRGVEEVVRLRAKDATWENRFDPIVFNSQRVGGSFQEILPQGEYLIEVSTPDNDGPYILAFGNVKGTIFTNYFSLLADTYKVKSFHGQPGIFFVFSPLFFVPVMILTICVFYFRHRRKYV